jgi:hypothetical protein
MCSQFSADKSRVSVSERTSFMWIFIAIKFILISVCRMVSFACLLRSVLPTIRYKYLFHSFLKNLSFSLQNFLHFRTYKFSLHGGLGQNFWMLLSRIWVILRQICRMLRFWNREIISLAKSPRHPWLLFVWWFSFRSNNRLLMWHFYQSLRSWS